MQWIMPSEASAAKEIVLQVNRANSYVKERLQTDRTNENNLKNHH